MRLYRDTAGRCDTALGWVRGARGMGAGRAAYALRLGQVGALCTWLSSDSVFDPVLFLSQFWGKNWKKKFFFEKKKIKSNQIRQNFQKIKYSKMEFLLIKMF